MVRLWRDRGVARRLMAVRDNETGAGAMGIPLARTKLLAFALSGFIAGYAGVCLAFATERISTATFDPTFSILVVSMVVIGGLGAIDGAVLGAIYLVGLPAIFGSTPTIQFLTSGLGLLAFILYLPGGLAELLHRLGDLVTLGIEQSGAAGHAPAPGPARSAVGAGGHRGGGVTGPDERRLRGPGPARPGGRVGGLRRGAGGRRRRSVGRAGGHRRADRAQRVGQDHPARRDLGAGDPQAGSVRLDGESLVEYLPEERSALGLVRSFQDCRLFPELSVEEVLWLTQDAGPPGGRAVLHPPDALGRRSERAKRAAADEVIRSFGIDRFRRHQIAQLSTGTRRVVDLASIVLARPRLLLLDEPTAGIAQREAEAFVPLLRRLHELADTTIVLVEHDVPLVFALCSKVVMMETGSVVSSGTPDEVGRDPRALAAYLGASEEALAVSGAVPTRRPERPADPPATPRPDEG